MLEIIKHNNRIFNSITYIIADRENNNYWLVDAGDAEDIFAFIKNGNLKGVFLTHIHFDHIYGLNKIITKYPDIIIYTNEFGKKALFNPSDNLSVYHGDEFILDSQANISCLSSGSEIKLNPTTHIDVVETPGHDKSCLCYLIEDSIFTGDSYIPGKEVFSKLQNGDSHIARKSLELILNLSRNKIIFPGHYIV